MIKEVNEWGSICYYKDEEKTILHRENGPAIEWANGDKVWWLNDKRHRVDGPAIEYSDGSNAWCLNGILHRIDGPAVEYSSGDKYWCLNGILHRIDGPAVEWSNGKAVEWWLDGCLMEFQKWKEEVRCFYDNQEDYLLMLLKL